MRAMKPSGLHGCATIVTSFWRYCSSCSSYCCHEAEVGPRFRLGAADAVGLLLVEIYVDD